MSERRGSGGGPLAGGDDSWQEGGVRAPTDAQQLGWPAIGERRDTLIAAPTGSGKTLAAFLASLDRPLSTTALAALLELSPGGASRHLLALRNAGFVSTTRHGHEVR